MTGLTIRSGPVSARVSPEGGVLLGAWFDRGDDGVTGHRRVPLLRAAMTDPAAATASACFPLVPFGNRVRDNRFRLQDRTHRFLPNTPSDRHYLHGDGWLSRWLVKNQAADAVTLLFRKTDGEETPYRYEAEQRITIRDGALVLSLSVRNEGAEALPFGLGWHPYFPLTPATTLQANARRFRTEVENWLPGEAAECPPDLDFATPRRLPERWVNNGLEDWSGEAEIVWPEQGVSLSLAADPLIRHAFLFVSDQRFDPGYRRDYFCFEPMSHRADGHNADDLGDLKMLAPGQTLSGWLTMTPRAIPQAG